MPLQAATIRCLRENPGPAAERTIRVRQGPADWCVRERWRNALFGLGAPDWLNLEDEERAEVVKAGRGRTVWRVTLGDGEFYAKVYRKSDGAELWKRRLIGHPAEREWRALLRAESRRVPVVHGLAVGVHGARGSCGVVITEGLPDATPLSQAWASDAGCVRSGSEVADRGRLIEVTAGLFAAAHEGGFFHRDAHPDNILISHPSGKGCAAVFADVHGGTFSAKGLSLAVSLRSLAHLDQHFHRQATRTRRLRFLRKYLSLRGSLRRTPPGSKQERALLEQYERVAATHAASLVRTRDRRIFRSGKYFATIELDRGWRVTVALQLERRHIFPEPDVPDRTAEHWTDILNRWLETAEDHAPTPHGAGDPAIDGTLKEEGLEIEVGPRSGSPVARLFQTLAGNPQGRAFVRCHKCRHRDIPSELILGYIEHRRWGLVDATMLIRPLTPVETDTKRKTMAGSPSMKVGA